MVKNCAGWRRKLSAEKKHAVLVGWIALKINKFKTNLQSIKIDYDIIGNIFNVY